MSKFVVKEFVPTKSSIFIRNQEVEVKRLEKPFLRGGKKYFYYVSSVSNPKDGEFFSKKYFNKHIKPNIVAVQDYQPGIKPLLKKLAVSLVIDLAIYHMNRKAVETDEKTTDIILDGDKVARHINQEVKKKRQKK